MNRHDEVNSHILQLCNLA